MLRPMTYPAYYTFVTNATKDYAEVYENKNLNICNWEGEVTQKYCNNNIENDFNFSMLHKDEKPCRVACALALYWKTKCKVLSVNGSANGWNKFFDEIVKSGILDTLSCKTEVLAIFRYTGNNDLYSTVVKMMF